MVVWNVRNQMKAVDYRRQAAMWTQIGELIQDQSVIALVEDYGSPLEYWGWRTVPTWPYTGDTRYARAGGVPIDQLFEEYSARKDLFLVTDFEELGRQSGLQEILDLYPVHAEGDDFVIYALREVD
jgi:hypothetical protein